MDETGVLEPAATLQSKEYRNKLIHLLQSAYSGEMAAAYAYEGHWKASKKQEEIDSIAKIEAEEWHHRKLAGEMLSILGAYPDPELERKRSRIGKTLRALCKVSGWFLPMYGAGRLESYNVIEYEDAADFARRCGHEEFVASLVEMADTEREHERYFRLKVESHFLHKVFPRWKIPPDAQSHESI
jgi:hypothetical protein